MIAAASRYDLAALIKLRRLLEEGRDCTVWFPDGTKAQFKPADLPKVIQKITYTM